MVSRPTNCGAPLMINKGILLGPHKLRDLNTLYRLILFFHYLLSILNNIIQQYHWKTGQLCSIHGESCRNCQMAIWLNFPSRLPQATSSHTMRLLPISFEHNSDFSAAVFPLALIAGMVHSLPYLFPPDPEPPQCRICYSFAPKLLIRIILNRNENIGCLNCMWSSCMAPNFLVTMPLSIGGRKMGLHIGTVFSNFSNDQTASISIFYILLSTVYNQCTMGTKS